MLRPALLIAALASLATSSSSMMLQTASCPGRTALPNFAGKSVFVMDDTLLFATSNIQLDIDGSPRAYGVRDQGTEDICNGLGPLNPPQCRGKNQGACFAQCRAAFRAWNGRPEDLKDVMCSIGLGGGGCGVPDVRLQSAPNQAWFVSETSVHPARPASEPAAGWLRRQEAQLDPNVIPYFVIPGGFRHLPWDASPGDVGIVADTAGRSFAFIVGDTGGSLNEGSARLLAAIRGLERLPTDRKRNAFGVEVDRLTGAVAGDYRVAIFRRTSRRPGGQGISLSLTSAEIPAFIESVSAERLQRLGGVARVRACSR
jgi:hypothetical protein